jgi:hypothetical protein
MNLARRVEIGHEQAMFKLLKILTANTVGIFFVRSNHWPPIKPKMTLNLPG